MGAFQQFRGSKYDKAIPIFIFVGVILYFGIKLSLDSAKAETEAHYYHFNGIVDSVSYSIKGQATVIIKGAHFELGFWDFDHDRIAKGDSLIKEKNSMIIKLIKRNGQIIIEGDSNR
jgi:hypothetical protein